MAESAFMLRQRKLLEEIKKNNGAPPLKSLYGPVTPTNNTDNVNQNIIGPGGQEFSEATNKVKSAYGEGGFSSALGVGLRNIPGVLAATVRDTLTPEPLRNLAGHLAGESKEVAQAALTGKAIPKSKYPLNDPMENKTPFEDRAANNLLYSKDTPDKLEVPMIREKQNTLRDQELGKMTSSEVANKNGGTTRTFNIGGNTLSYNTEDAPEGSFTAGGTDRKLSEIKQPNEAATEYERKFRNMGTNQRVAEPTVSSERLKQWDFQQGLKSGRSQRPIGPYASMGAKAKRELMNIREKNKQSGLNNAVTNATANERNDILRENNYLQSQVKQRPESMKVKRYDPISGNVLGEDIVTANADGTYPGAMSNQIKTPSPASKALMISMKGDKAHEAEYVKRFGKLPY